MGLILMASTFSLFYLMVPFVSLWLLALGKPVYDPKVIFLLFISLWASDTGAFFVGKSWGKTALAPYLSPNKTIEGLIGGLLLALLTSALYTYFTDVFPLVVSLALAAVVAVFGTMGDIIESAFKRMAGTKDSGTILPGHGGILDRFDGLMLAAPAVYVTLQLLERL